MKRFIVLLLLFLIHFLLLINLKFTAWPEMLAYPYLLQKGFHFYRDIVHPYLPLLPYAILAFSRVFGLSVLTIQGITYAIIFINDLILWFIVNMWFKRRFAIFLLMFYIVLQLLMDGNGLWFDLAASPMILAAMYMFWNYLVNKDYWIYPSGLILGVAFLVKQTVVVFIIFELLFLIFTRRFKELILYALVTLLPLMSLFLFFIPKQLIDWGVVFPLFAASRLPGYILLPTLKQLVVVILVLSPLVIMWKTKEPRLWLSVIWTVLALTFIFPRFDYFHLQPLLPFLVLTLGFIITKSQKIQWFNIYLSLYLIIVGGLFIRYFMINFHQPPRFFNSKHYDKANQLSQKLPHSQPIFFYNTSANYFITANLTPAKPWVDTFPWYLEIQGMQERIVASLEEMRVEWVVATDFTPGNRFSLGSYRPQKINEYIQQNFYDFDQIDPTFRILKRRG